MTSLPPVGQTMHRLLSIDKDIMLPTDPGTTAYQNPRRLTVPEKSGVTFSPG